jgi:hypothetical protein
MNRGQTRIVCPFNFVRQNKHETALVMLSSRSRTSTGAVASLKPESNGEADADASAPIILYFATLGAFLVHRKKVAKGIENASVVCYTLFDFRFIQVVHGKLGGGVIFDKTKTSHSLGTSI